MGSVQWGGSSPCEETWLTPPLLVSWGFYFVVPGLGALALPVLPSAASSPPGPVFSAPRVPPGLRVRPGRWAGWLLWWLVSAVIVAYHT